MGNSYTDISVLEKKETFFIEPFEWVHPENVTGFSRETVRKENIRSYEEDDYNRDSDTADIIVASYLEECLYVDSSNYMIFLEYGLWLITELYSIYVVHIFPSDMREHLPRESNKLNHIFDEIYKIFLTKDKEGEYHCANLLKIFIFEVFQFGSEWGNFDIKHIDCDSMFLENNLIESAAEGKFLCSYLNKENLANLSALVDYSKGHIPQYKYC